MMNVKFMWNGIKVDGVLYRAHYSIHCNGDLPEGTITIYGKNYEDLPMVRGLQVENDSDSMTDYFENDRIRVTPKNRYYQEVKEAYNKQQAHYQKRFEKKYGNAE